ncbi:hypothetical protein A5675_05330 [Mycobacterium malmoense]|nr:hypothetical protein A5675_05330 [Mycobacterium malmoense]
MLERAAQPPVDRPRRPPGTDDLAVALEPRLTRGITGQVAAFGVGEQRTQMQRGRAPLNVDVDHDRGVLPVWPAGRFGIPPGLDQTQERLEGARQRRPLLRPVVAAAVLAIAVIVLPLGDQRITMRRQRGVEFRRVEVREFDPPTGQVFIRVLDDRGFLWPIIGFGSWLQLDRRAQLADRSDPRQLGVMLIRSRTAARRDDADLIQRQPTLPHALRAARELPEPARDGGDRVSVGRR